MLVEIPIFKSLTSKPSSKPKLTSRTQTHIQPNNRIIKHKHKQIQIIHTPQMPIAKDENQPVHIQTAISHKHKVSPTGR